MSQLTLTRLAAALASIVTAIGATNKVRLFTNTPTIRKEMSSTDFTEPVGDWYDPTDAGHPKCVYGEPYLDADGNLVVAAASVQFNFATGGDAEPVYIKGYYVTDAAGTTVHHAELLPQEVYMSGDYDSLVVLPKLGVKTLPV